MDPNLFHLDWGRTTEVLAAVIIVSLLVERALALLFEWRVFLNKFDKKGLKEPIAYLVSLVICIVWDFDAVSMIILRDQTSLLGEAVTAGIIAGGSKGSVELFREYIGIKSSYLKEKDEEKKRKQEEEKSAADEAPDPGGDTP